MHYGNVVLAAAAVISGSVISAACVCVAIVVILNELVYSKFG